MMAVVRRTRRDRHDHRLRGVLSGRRRVLPPSLGLE
jgi:hypothetical protein